MYNPNLLEAKLNWHNEGYGMDNLELPSEITNIMTSVREKIFNILDPNNEIKRLILATLNGKSELSALQIYTKLSEEGVTEETKEYAMGLLPHFHINEIEELITQIEKWDAEVEDGLEQLHLHKVCFWKSERWTKLRYDIPPIKLDLADILKLIGEDDMDFLIALDFPHSWIISTKRFRELLDMNVVDKFGIQKIQELWGLWTVRGRLSSILFRLEIDPKMRRIQDVFDEDISETLRNI